MNREPFAEGEWYHCYNRGVDKRRIFTDTRDYERFLMLLYVSNSQKRIHLSNFAQPPRQGPTLPEVLGVDRGSQLVEIGVYSLMPNHFHLLLKPLESNGIVLFMQKLSTGYAMYFNKRHDRSGTLLQGKFKSKRIESDQYFRRLVNYIHANVAELYEPCWKQGKVKDEKNLFTKLKTYRFSSLPDYLVEDSQNSIINKKAVLDMLGKFPTVETLLEEARIFAREG